VRGNGPVTSMAIRSIGTPMEYNFMGAFSFFIGFFLEAQISHFEIKSRLKTIFYAINGRMKGEIRLFLRLFYPKVYIKLYLHSYIVSLLLDI
jgi:hypothetical protein